MFERFVGGIFTGRKAQPVGGRHADQRRPAHLHRADRLDCVAELRQAGDLSALPVGRNVVVIGGGMTAVDAAVQSKLLGAESVTV